MCRLNDWIDLVSIFFKLNGREKRWIEVTSTMHSLLQAACHASALN